jgi:hypothetical protein
VSPRLSIVAAAPFKENAMTGKLTLAMAALMTTLMAGGLHAQASAT